MLQIARCNFRWPVGDLGQHTPQFVQKAGHLRITSLLRAYAVKMIVIQQVARHLLLRGEVDSAAILVVNDLKQQHLRALQVIAHRDQNDALRVHRRGRLLLCDWLLMLLPESPSQERADQQQRHYSREGPFLLGGEQPAKEAAPFRQTVSEIEPGFFLEICGRLRNFQRLNLPEHRFHARELRPAFGAHGQVALDLRFALRVTVIMQYDLFFTQVVHFIALPPSRAGCADPGPAYGSSCCRSFCTARKTLFLAALIFRFSAWLISSMERPSIWRIVKATRSAGVSSPMAPAILRFISALNSRRSGPGLDRKSTR